MLKNHNRVSINLKFFKMSITKLKNIFLSLATVAFLSFMLSSCQQDDIVQDLEDQLNVKTEVVDDLESRACSNCITDLSLSSVSYRAETGRTVYVLYYSCGTYRGYTSYNAWACKPYTKTFFPPSGTNRVKAYISNTVVGACDMEVGEC